jgi:PilZ domain
MEKELICSSYRNSQTVENGPGRGLCDLDGNQAICNGDLASCDKPNRISMTQNEQKGNGEERRKHPRVVLDLPLEYRLTNIPNAHGALIVNGSEMGLLMESVKNIPVGTNLNIVILFPKGYELADLEVSAQIVWKEFYWKEDWEGYQYGLKFVSIRAHDRWKLRQLLSNQYNVETIPF